MCQKSHSLYTHFLKFQKCIKFAWSRANNLKEHSIMHRWVISELFTKHELYLILESTWGCTESVLPRPLHGMRFIEGKCQQPPPQNKQIKLISNFLEIVILTREEMEESGLSSSSEDLTWDGFSRILVLSKASFWLEKKSILNLHPKD